MFGPKGSAIAEPRTAQRSSTLSKSSRMRSTRYSRTVTFDHITDGGRCWCAPELHETERIIYDDAGNVLVAVIDRLYVHMDEALEPRRGSRPRRPAFHRR